MKKIRVILKRRSKKNAVSGLRKEGLTKAEVEVLKKHIWRTMTKRGKISEASKLNVLERLSFILIRVKYTSRWHKPKITYKPFNKTFYFYRKKKIYLFKITDVVKAKKFASAFCKYTLNSNENGSE